MLAMNAVVIARHVPEFPGLGTAAHGPANGHTAVTRSVSAITGGLA
ncbi:hypothetical protein ACFS32_07125 [Novosphingobium pokkalii]|jgi:hypothetical protein